MRIIWSAICCALFFCFSSAVIFVSSVCLFYSLAFFQLAWSRVSPIRTRWHLSEIDEWTRDAKRIVEPVVESRQSERVSRHDRVKECRNERQKGTATKIKLQLARQQALLSCMNWWFLHRLMKRFFMHHCPFDAIIKLLNIYRDRWYSSVCLHFCARSLRLSPFLSLTKLVCMQWQSSKNLTSSILCRWCTPIE